MLCIQFNQKEYVLARGPVLPVLSTSVKVKLKGMTKECIVTAGIDTFQQKQNYQTIRNRSHGEIPHRRQIYSYKCCFHHDRWNCKLFPIGISFDVMVFCTKTVVVIVDQVVLAGNVLLYMTETVNCEIGQVYLAHLNKTTMVMLKVPILKA